MISNQLTNYFMKRGCEKYLNKNIILQNDEWYTPAEFVELYNMENDFGPEYIFDTIVNTVQMSVANLKKQGFRPNEDGDDESFNLCIMNQFLHNAKEALFESILNETTVELYPQDGKLQARAIGQQVTSSKTTNKLSGLGVKDTTQPLTKQQLAATKAVIADLKAQNKLQDISKEFDTNPQADITFMGNGDAVITPDGNNKRPYKLPAAEIDQFFESLLGV